MATNQNEYNQAVQNLIKMVGTKLVLKKVWTNASPASAFANQTLKLGLSGYDFVIILFKLDKNGRMASPSIVPIGHPAVSAYGANTRFFLVHENDIRFDDASSNSVMIPYEIYGMKGVI